MDEALTGDDVWEDDPTVNQFQTELAKMLRKPAALFMPSVTMANLIALMHNCERGNQCILGDKSHIYSNTSGGISAVGAIYANVVPNEEDGTFDLRKLRAAIPELRRHLPRVKVISIENPHTTCGGRLIPNSYIQKVKEICKENSPESPIKLHLDGQRIFHAATASKQDISKIVEHFDTITFCLNKGLGLLGGACVVGSKEFIKDAIYKRKALGGGVRQMGNLLGPGFEALKNYKENCQIDIDNAKFLAQELK